VLVLVLVLVLTRRAVCPCCLSICQFLNLLRNIRVRCCRQLRVWRNMPCIFLYIVFYCQFTIYSSKCHVFGCRNPFRESVTICQLT